MEHTLVIQEVIEKLLHLLESDATVDVAPHNEGYRVQINTPETGMLIGYHGETLTALQLIVGQLVYKRTGEWLKITLNVGDYLEKRQEQLKLLADKAVEKVKATQMSETLPFLTARERRFIHMYLENIGGVKTESVGEGEERRLVIFPSFDQETA